MGDRNHTMAEMVRVLLVALVLLAVAVNCSEVEELGQEPEMGLHSKKVFTAGYKKGLHAGMNMAKDIATEMEKSASPAAATKPVPNPFKPPPATKKPVVTKTAAKVKAAVKAGDTNAVKKQQKKTTEAVKDAVSALSKAKGPEAEAVAEKKTGESKEEA